MEIEWSSRGTWLSYRIYLLQTLPVSQSLQESNSLCKIFPASRTAIDGHWGRWSDWSSCSVTCGDGYRKRYRKCDNPAPVQGGLNCPGSSTEADGCVMRRCTLGKDYWLCLIHAEISLCSYTFINVVVLPIVTSFFTLLTLLSWTHYFSRSCFIFMSIEMKRLNVHLRTRFF